MKSKHPTKRPADGGDTWSAFLSNRVDRIEQRLDAAFDRYGYTYARLAFAFVFVLFGAQKPIVPGSSPVGYDVSLFASRVGLEALPGPITWVLLFIGCYEMGLGLLILLDRIRLAVPFFFAHQLTTLVAPFVVADTAFRAPYLELGWITIPYAFDWFAAFALKNVLFVAAFCFVFTEHRRRHTTQNEPSASEPPASA